LEQKAYHIFKREKDKEGVDMRNKTYGGIPLAELSKLARMVDRGRRCSIDKDGYLNFHYKTGHDNKNTKSQLRLSDKGKLICLGGYDPGCWISKSEEFANRANMLFTFSAA